jgi:hypothetical protein
MTTVVPRISLLIVAAEPIAEVPTLREYYRDLDSIIYAASDGESKSFAYKRLQYLDGKWNLYSLLNERQEMLDSKVTSISSSINSVESASSRLLQRSKSRYPRPPFVQHEPKTSPPFH